MPPRVGETPNDFATRLMNGRYGEGNWTGRGPGSEFSQLKKAYRGYEIPQWILDAVRIA
jgi:hypothetical protein